MHASWLPWRPPSTNFQMNKVPTLVTPLREQVPAATSTAAHQTAILKVHVIEQDSPIDATTPPIDDEAVMHKVTLRLLPYIGVLYMLCFLDRINLSNVHGTILNGM